MNWNALENDDELHLNIRWRGGGRKDDTRQLNKMLRRAAKPRFMPTRRPFTAAGGGVSRGAFNPADNRQFCVAKMRYSSKMGSHKKFLNVYMGQHNKDEVLNKPELFGTSDYEEHMTARHYKFIISPDSQDVDCELLTRELVSRMEAETGYAFYWKAAVHTDTGQKHTHLLINGVDRNGKVIDRFPREFVQNRVREIARNICTEMTGERTAEQKALFADRAFAAKRWTKYDEEIERHLEKAEKGYTVFAATDIEKRRLAELAKIGLTVRGDTPRRFYLFADWKDTLKAVGRYNTFLEEKKKDPRLRLYQSGEGKITGRVERLITMNDEEVWNNAAVVRNDKAGVSYYVPLFRPLDPKKYFGKNVEVEAAPGSKGQMVIEPRIIQGDTIQSVKHAQKQDDRGLDKTAEKRYTRRSSNDYSR